MSYVRLFVDLDGSNAGPEFHSVELVLDAADWSTERIREGAAAHYQVPLDQVGIPVREPDVRVGSAAYDAAANALLAAGGELHVPSLEAALVAAAETSSRGEVAHAAPPARGRIASGRAVEPREGDQPRAAGS